MSIELKQAAQQAVDAFDAFGDADDFASLFALTQKMHALRTAIQQAEAQHPATGEPVKAAPYNPTEEMRWAMKRIDPALSSDQCRALWSAAWSASPSTHPSPSVPDDVARDAERYRWLREQNESLESFTFYVGCDNGPDDDGSVEWVGADLDAAIDAAMLAAK